MARKGEDNVTLFVIVALGGYVLWRQIQGRAVAAVPASPVTGGAGAKPSPVTTPPVSGNLPRGIRNNNPGNIKVGASNWRGKIGNDGTFERFDTAVNGIRAAMLLLRTYANQYGLNTIAKIGSRWAPVGSGEKGNAGWAGGVSQYSGIGANVPLNLSNQATMLAVMRGIVAQENGGAYAGYYPASVYSQAWGAM